MSDTFFRRVFASVVFVCMAVLSYASHEIGSCIVVCVGFLVSSSLTLWPIEKKQPETDADLRRRVEKLELSMLSGRRG